MIGTKYGRCGNSTLWSRRMFVFKLFSTCVIDSVNDTCDGTGTANSEMAGERTEESQALL